MGPKVKFTKDQIIDAAFDIAKTEGIDGVSMRKIAEKLNSSVAPIYVNFKDVNELIEAIVARIISISNRLLEEEDTGNPFNDMGMASLRFAKEYSVLFRDLVMKSNSHMEGYDEKMLPVLIEEMKKDPELEGFNEDELRIILLKMKIFQIGLSVMVANGLLTEAYGKQDIRELLSSAASDVIVSARLRREELNRNEKGK